jgi:uncharacterized membrane protein
MKKKKVVLQVLTSFICGIVLLLSLVPNIGYLLIPGGISVTIIHIPVLIGIILLPFTYSLIVGLFFGLSSLIASLLYASSVFDIAFQNPLVSVLPRILFALIFFFIVKFIKYFFSKEGKHKFIGFIIVSLLLICASLLLANFLSVNFKWNFTIVLTITSAIDVVLVLLTYLSVFRLNNFYHFALSIGCFIGTIIHTVLVLTALFIFTPSLFTGSDNDLTLFGLLSLVLFSNGVLEALLASISVPIISKALSLTKVVNDITN